MAFKRISCSSFCGIYRKGLTQEEKSRFRRLLMPGNLAAQSDSNFVFDGDDYIVSGCKVPSTCAAADPAQSGGSIILMFNDTDQSPRDGNSFDWFKTEVNSFNSSWTACLVDDVCGQVFLARDPIGAQTVYSGHMGDAFIFTSSLTYLQNLGFNVDSDAIGNLLHFLYIPAPPTIFQGVRSILPGECVVFDGSSIELKYTKLSSEYPDSFQSQQAGDAVERYENLLAESARKHSLSSGTVGLFLSGGKDSSALAIAAKLAGLDNIVAVTLGFSDQAIDEGGDARCVAEHLGIPFRLLRFTEKEYFELWPEVVDALGQPMGDFAVLPVYAAIRKLRNEIDVFWEGSGSDPPFGSPVTREEEWGWQLNRRLPLLRSLPWKKFPLGFSYTADKLGSILGRPREEQFVSWNGWSAEEIVHLTGRSLNLSESALYRLYAECQTPMEHKSRTLNEIWAPGTAYRKIGQSANMQGCLVRFPFLDKQLMHFTRNLPENKRYLYRQSKILLRDVLARHLPENILNKRKGSFMFPKRFILNGRNFELLRTYLSDNAMKKHGIVDYKVANRYVKEYMQGNQGLEDRIWVLLMLHTWLERRLA